DLNYAEFEIQVEEYKRPTFNVKFEPVTETYTVNDSVFVKGKAKTFSGANLSNAKVSYKVERTAYNTTFRSFDSKSVTIDFGEIITDSEGSFTIGFEAIPDLSFSKENLPIFNYNIVADVTDIQGETQSSSTVVKVGYHNLTLNVQLA